MSSILFNSILFDFQRRYLNEYFLWISSAPIDLGIIIDTSDHGGSFGGGKLNTLKAHVKELIGALHVSKLGHHVGLVSSSSSGATVVSGLNAFHNEATLKQHLDQMQSSSGVMDLASALATAKGDLFDKSYRRYTLKLLLVLVASDSTTNSNVDTRATALKESRVRVVTVGIDFRDKAVGRQHLNRIATRPDKLHVMMCGLQETGSIFYAFRTRFLVSE